MLKEVLSILPDGGAIVILSGGMDSTIAMRLCVERYGAQNVRALTFDYGQKQSAEVDKARSSTSLLGVEHKVLDLSVLGDIAMGYSANVDKNIAMPTIKDILGDPAPKTEVPNRNMVMLSLAAAYAQTRKIPNIITGLQVHDEYSYWDTTQRFVDAMNSVLAQNRITQVKILAPFSHLSKQKEIKILKDLDGNLDLLAHTLTCYNPNDKGESCGDCPSCSERINAFMVNGVADPVPYSRVIKWP